MEKPSFKLVGAPCGHHGQYTFYKAIRLSGKQDRILAIGDFFFVRIWQDSELVSIGELQLLWTDRVSDQTLVSLRLYFLPENTPDGRGQHGEDEVLAINDKVVLKAEDLLSWVCSGTEWRWGRRAVWRGACAPPSDARVTAPLHQTRLDLSDVDKEKDAIVIDEDSPGVVVFSYPRYCRYRAVAARLAGLQAAWLRDSLVAALGGYSAPTRNTRILYCKDTFEYPELEGHEFVCSHLAPRLKARGRRRRRAPGDRSSDDDQPPRRPSLRGDKQSSDDESEPQTDEQAFIDNLKHFYRDRDEEFTRGISLKDLSLRALYSTVTSKGGYEAVCRHKQWGVLFADQTAHTRRHYERYLLPYEKHERRNGLTSGDNAGSDIAAITSPKHDVDNETGETKEDMTIVSKPAEELNREFLESLPLDEKTAKISVKPVEMLRDGQSDGTGAGDGFLKDLPLPRPVVYNGHVPAGTDQPRGRSSLRAVRVKPARAAPPANPPTPPASAPAVTNFGIHRPPPAPRNHASDDDIVEVPYKPKTPEIIDLDEYPESPQAVKKKKLDILKERGLEVTALPPAAGIWPAATPLIAPTPVLLNPAVQHQIMTNAQLFQMYNIIPQYPNGVQPPKVIQGTSIFGSSNPEKTVYGNPKDPFMPPPHILHGVPVRPQRSVPVVNTPQDILDLTCKINSKPTVEIVRVPNSPSPSKNSPQNLTKNFSIVDGKAVVGSNLEITLVNKSHSPKSKSPLKRSSNGKFVSNTPTPPKESPKPPKKPNIIVPNYQINENLQIPSQNLPKEQQKTPPVSFLDPYMALYSLAGQIDPRQLAAYRDLMTNQVRGYNSFLNMGVSHPTTKN